MKTSNMIQSKFLKKEDFPQPAVMTIRSVALEKVGQSDQRWVLYFNEHTKGVVLNATKIKQLEIGFGDDTDHWAGKRIRLENDPSVMMNNIPVGGIKFTLPKAQAAPPPPPPASVEFDDDIPF